MQQMRRSPFDDGAIRRLQRMGLLDDRGNAIEETVVAVGRAYAGALFDELYDYGRTDGMGWESLCWLIEEVEQAEGRKKLLQICLQYDSLSKPLPDLIWWISGSGEVAEVFAVAFVRHMKELCMEVMRE